MYRLARLSLLSVLFFLISLPSQANQLLTQRKDVQQFINERVKHDGFNRKELTTIFNNVQIQPQIIESMEKPYEKKTWDVYKALFLTSQRVNEGLKFWEENQKTLEKAEKQFGIPAHIIVAIIGVETLYGKHQGNYRVIDALSTLAFNYPKRSRFFKKELREYLLLCRENNISPDKYLGSYAGAIGKPQFMPSSYRFYAVDFTGNGKIDLINSNEDVIGSVANYFRKHGWKMNEGVVQLAKVQGKKYKKIKTNSKKANYTLKKLMKAGVKPETAALNLPSKAGLIELITDNGKEYWLAYPNFYVITRYNTSPQYALVVYLLSQQLKSQWKLAHIRKAHAYA
ncbi:lytic murein transglycosylase B [Legionella israelensis]|uniref:Membrane bound lytic murein transglycosylase n=1 Tax=Legionella israelensis TaxID=454 RepID=A0A0W0WBZ8_9GAMM|nr:lytic murein transglycosylase B [Legionella israelensis]KTD29758.1 membrane bound lytic murein transglycosylase [Legionella israelensis]QBS08883.1 lytic murein transglycosylase B [Legionella israelensis]SCY03020.1 membrane-bound lytic murein transglycosylase B [Legionella israelensis DSM 19235]STX58569.1 membrane bound lytic murein transglycosylase [Legionella israelensis]